MWQLSIFVCRAVAVVIFKIATTIFLVSFLFFFAFLCEGFRMRYSATATKAEFLQVRVLLRCHLGALGALS